MTFTILVIDDEKNIRAGLSAALELDGYSVRQAANGREGLAQIDKGDIDLVITDLRMPGISGEEVLARVAAENPGIPVIVLTGHGTIDTAVEAMRKGAYDFLTKPVDLDHLSLIVKRALGRRELEIRHATLKQEFDKKSSFESIIGKSEKMRRIFQMVQKVADSKASVLITGESGTGKELIANALHNLSSRKNNPLIKVHCAALSETLLESELFGHEKGAFTGAATRTRGRFELADKGSIFLDEIGEINQTVQVKILRVLNDKRFERVGGEETLEVDVRVIAATNRNLEEEIKENRFREDLFFRLNVVNIHMPPLRERKEDIPLMINSFLDEFNRENNKSIKGFDARSRAAINRYDWPGNIRELRNCIESAVVMCSGAEISLEDLPSTVAKAEDCDIIQIPMGTTMEEAEKVIIQQTLASNQGNKSKTAEVLGIGRKTLHRKLEEYGGE